MSSPTLVTIQHGEPSFAAITHWFALESTVSCDEKYSPFDLGLRPMTLGHTQGCSPLATKACLELAAQNRLARRWQPRHKAATSQFYQIISSICSDTHHTW
jgi:hypothetical protein